MTSITRSFIYKQSHFGFDGWKKAVKICKYLKNVDSNNIETK